MMEKAVIKNLIDAVKKLYVSDVEPSDMQIQSTKKDFEGDITVVVFPLLKYSGKSPEDTASELGEYILEVNTGFTAYNVVKGFLNLQVSKTAWLDEFIRLWLSGSRYSFSEIGKDRITLIEYSSPNTNKPLHLGHIRNNLLGYSLSRILTGCGYKVYKTNIVNDRGIHICKSMLAWQLFGQGKTPSDTGMKGDHFVGEYYVEFEKAYKKETEKLVSEGLTREEAAEQSKLMHDARQLLRKWESGDKEVVSLWEKMNSWVYEGFDATYEDMGVDFDKVYYESDTYKLGRDIVNEGLEKGIFHRKKDGSVWVNLSSDKLDEKLLLRTDGTAVYMTQDIGTAVQRYNDYKFDRQYYVVGNEQNYHFQVLKLILKKLGYKWAEGIHHFSYGMVNLPEGKMKSREGKVVDADDLIDTMVITAREMSEELGKLHDYDDKEKKEIYRKIGLGALKYFILKVDPRKNMMFNPRESIDFNGNTGPFVQYTYARIKSVLRKGEDKGYAVKNISADVVLNEKECDLIKLLRRFNTVVVEAAETLNPSVIANYAYELAREYNQFYHDYTILGEENDKLKDFRICLSEYSGIIINESMRLLGIDMPERM
ncbi:MAG TPA: arginine--tRNA ligase [Bacteroidales bacterium]|nr:arginine--tRNA ligase [Bacteroidales bacterium]